MKKMNINILIGIFLVLAFLLVPVTTAESDTVPEAGYIEVGLQPVADFDVYYPFNSVPMRVTFYDRSTGSTPMTYLWDFGDGSVSNEQNPRHNYIGTGPYTVTLTVANQYGKDTKVKKEVVSLGLGPRADFTAAPSTGSVPLPVIFTDTSSRNPTSWLWEFGDGITSNEQNPLHTYRAGGKYTVTLTVANEYGSSTTTKSGLITAIKSLKARFTADPATGKVPLTVKFTDTSLGGAETWAWDFGDGAQSTEKNPVHTFTAAGAYDVKLTVTGAGGSDSATQTVNAGGVPVADFSADKTEAGVYEYIQFTDKTTNSPTKWEWNFGDGATTNEQNPKHQYLDKGIYTVTLTARNDNGKDVEIKKDYINIGLAPIADFYSDSQTIGVPDSVRFIDRSTRNPTSWLWDFGDGTTSVEQSPTHIYRAIGTYTVTLTAKNNAGSSTKVSTDYIKAGFGPVAEFTATPQSGPVGTFIRFTDQSRNSPTEWLWEFGDGTSSTDQNPFHQYSRAGDFRVTLTVVNPYSWSSTTKNNFITITGIEKEAPATPTPAQNLKPVAKFTVDQRIGKAPFIVKFEDLSLNNPTSWHWQFGDGGTSDEQHPIHVYKYEGVYNVTLTVSNMYGSDTLYSSDIEEQTPAAKVTATATPTPLKTPAAIATTPEIIPVTTTKATPTPLSSLAVILSLVIIAAVAVLAKRK